jgi:hypothetical protein
MNSTPDEREGNGGQTVGNIFCNSAGAVLIFTSVAKMWSALGSAKLLSTIDPIVGTQFRYLMIFVSGIEIIVARVCWSNRSRKLAIAMVAWLSTCFFLYRFGLWWIGWQSPCACLGNFTDALHISPQLADNIMKGVLAYLLIGSYGILFWQWWQGRAQKVEIGNQKLGI